MVIIVNPGTLIRTSVVLSGLLGLRFDGIPYGNGKTATIAGMIPIQVACLNQTTPLQVISSFSKVSKQLLPKSLTALSSFGMVKPSMPSYPKPKVITLPNPKKTPAEPAISPTPSPSQSKVNSDKNTGKADSKQPKKNSLTGRTVSSCEDSSCSRNETCVTWINADSDSSSNDKQRSSKEIHECILQDFNSPIKFSPVNPTSTQLCPEGKTHSVTSGSFRKQCAAAKDIPCSIIWKFTCVDTENSPHDCNLKSCPLNACVEEMSCKLGEDSRPCIPQATCLPPYFFPSATTSLSS